MQDAHELARMYEADLSRHWERFASDTPVEPVGPEITFHLCNPNAFPDETVEIGIVDPGTGRGHCLVYARRCDVPVLHGLLAALGYLLPPLEVVMQDLTDPA